MAGRSKAKPPKKGPSQRQLRVGEQLRHVLMETLQRGKFHDEILINRAPDVTVTEVKTSPDLKNATAFVMMLNNTPIDDVLPALTESAQIFQREFAKKLGMKFTPKIHFKYDDTFENARRIDEILHNLPRITGHNHDTIIDEDEFDDDDFDDADDK